MEPGLTEAPLSKRFQSNAAPANGQLSARWLRVAHSALLALAVLSFALHFVHLAADFPSHSPWMDWSKYTDEGWYGDGAIRQLQRGHWYVPGDFNPATALPVWPLLEFAVFSVTGVSIVAARALSVAVFGGILVASFFLLQRFSARHSLAPAAAVALLAISPFCYVFTRLAILEPLLILLGLLGLLVASDRRGGATTLPKVLGLGLLLPLMVLTKTTAVFLVPSITWMLWASGGYRVRPFLRTGIPAGAIAVLLWGAYFFFLVRPRYVQDYRYLFSANAYTGMTRANAAEVLANTLRDAVWMGRLLCLFVGLAVLASLVWLKRTLRCPLIPAFLLWAAGYAAFLAYHNNLQPRYYLVIAVPLTLLLPVVVEQLLYPPGPQTSTRSLPKNALLAASYVVGFLSLFLTDALQTSRYILQPDYTFLQVAHQLSSIIRADHDHNPLLLSISGSDISLMAGLPSICDDFGTMTLEDRAATYRPGWYATWNEVDDDKMDALAPLFHLQRIAAFPVFDDPERNLLILYRLDPPQPEQPRPQRRRSVPRALQTRLGQQPSPTQLEH